MMHWGAPCGSLFIVGDLGRALHVLLDLDGTLVDTNASKFDDIKFGRDRNFALSDIPFIPGAQAFVEAIRRLDHSVTIVSDSHDAYVGPLAEKVFGASWVALADKPNTTKLRAHLEKEFRFPDRAVPKEFLFVGDTRLDVQLSRGLALPSVRILRDQDNFPHDPRHSEIKSWARQCKEGATYNCRSFDEVICVIESQAEHRLVLEDPVGTATARLFTGRTRNNGHSLVRGLGRQQQGPCDAYGAVGRYRNFGSEDRTEDFLSKVAHDVSRYLRKEVLAQGFARWDTITCVADKTTTRPPMKMAKLLHALDVNLPKEELFIWLPEVTGSIRHEKKRADRIEFINRFVRLDSQAELQDKNIIIIDDQYTTGATAMAHIEMLLQAGVRNVLFLALFYLADDVPTQKTCPRCGKPTRIKYGPNGSSFYSCAPPKYGGTGCGWTENIANG